MTLPPQRGAVKRKRGSAMVEGALILTTVMAMILFIVDMGRMLLWQQFIVERARVGVRNAVVNNWDATAVANYVVYGASTAPSGQTSGFLGLTPSEVTLTKYTDSGVGDARYQVKVSNVAVFTWIPFMAGKYTLPPVTATMSVQSLGATD
jgi:hypothetical protein